MNNDVDWVSIVFCLLGLLFVGVVIFATYDEYKSDDYCKAIGYDE